MAEKIWCKYCKVFVVDTKFEQAQHDGTFKHKANYQRALNAIHRENIESKKQNNASERALADIEKALKKSGKSFVNIASSSDKSHIIEKPKSGSKQEDTKEQIADSGDSVKAEYRSSLVIENKVPNKWVGTTTSRILNKDELEAQKRQLVQLGVNFADVKTKIRAENAEASQWTVIEEKTVVGPPTSEDESRDETKYSFQPSGRLTNSSMQKYQVSSNADKRKNIEYNKWNLDEKIAPSAEADSDDDLPPIILKRNGDSSINLKNEKDGVKVEDIKPEPKDLAKPSLFKKRKVGLAGNSRKN